MAQSHLSSPLILGQAGQDWLSACLKATLEVLYTVSHGGDAGLLPAPPPRYPGHCSPLLPSLACDPSTCHQESFTVAAFRSKKVKVREKSIACYTYTLNETYL